MYYGHIISEFLFILVAHSGHMLSLDCTVCRALGAIGPCHTLDIFHTITQIATFHLECVCNCYHNKRWLASPLTRAAALRVHHNLYSTVVL